MFSPKNDILSCAQSPFIFHNRTEVYTVSQLLSVAIENREETIYHLQYEHLKYWLNDLEIDIDKRAQSPFYFHGNKEIHTLKELLLIISEYREESLIHIECGYFLSWLESFLNIKNKQAKSPFIFENETKASTIGEFLLAIPNHKEEALYQLKNGHFEAWLKELNGEELLPLAIEARESSKQDLSVIDEFISNGIRIQLGKYLDDAKKKKLTFLLVGDSGVGKSTTINSLVGKHVAETHRYTSCTKDVISYDFKLNDVECTVIDTPGFEYRDIDENHLEKIREHTSKSEVDLIWFVAKLDSTRLEINCINLISNLVKESNWGWERSMVVFTRADKFTLESYQEVFSDRTTLIREEIKKHTDEEIADNIPFVAVSNDPNTEYPLPTPDGRSWMGELYAKIFTRISQQSAFSFLIATADRVRKKENPSNDLISKEVQNGDIEEQNYIIINKDQILEIKEALLEQNIVGSSGNNSSITKNINFESIVGLVTIGGTIGGGVGGPFGAAVGATAGAAIGMIAWMFG